MIIPDEAIKTKQQDILGRAEFANQLARAISTYKREESLVIGLMGEWGSGKSSIINLVKESIENESNQNRTPVIFEFNPWYFSEQEGLILNFFIALSIQFQKPDYSELVKKIGERVETYASLFEPLSILPGVGIIPFFMIRFAKLFGHNLVLIGEKKKSIEDEKKALNKEFCKLNNKLLIIIDDIDRLTDREIRQMFQLIKKSANFPNTIYLLAFDKDVVIPALSGDHGSGGKKYLEKIVQMPIEVPAVKEVELNNYFEATLKHMMNRFDLALPDQYRWRNIYYGGVRFFYGNIRDVKRLFNALYLELGLVLNDVDLIDYITLTAIKVYYPEIYNAIGSSKYLIFRRMFELTQGEELISMGEEKRSHLELVYKAIDSQEIDEKTKKHLRYVIGWLFPNINNNISEADIKKYAKNKRICSRDYFDRYFVLSLQEFELSDPEIQEILELTTNGSLLFDKIEQLKPKELIYLLQYLEYHYDEKIQINKVRPLVTALSRVGDTLSEEYASYIGSSGERLVILLSNLLSLVVDEEEKYRIVLNCISKDSESVAFPVFFVSRLLRNAKKERSKLSPADIVFDSERLEVLQEHALLLIKNSAKKGLLIGHDDAVYLLTIWSDWERKSASQYLRNIISSKPGIAKVLSIFVKMRSESNANDIFPQEKKYFYKTSLQEFLEKFDDVTITEEEVRKVFEDVDILNSLSQNEQFGIRSFLQGDK